MLVVDNIVIFYDKSIARIEFDGNIEFAPNYNTGKWRKPYSKKNKLPVHTFKIGASSKEDALGILQELEKLCIEEENK
jgi:hypothetical protein